MKSAIRIVLTFCVLLSGCSLSHHPDGVTWARTRAPRIAQVTPSVIGEDCVSLRNTQIHTIYNRLLGRNPESSEAIEFWSRRMFDTKAVVQFIARSPEGRIFLTSYWNRIYDEIVAQMPSNASSAQKTGLVASLVSAQKSLSDIIATVAINHTTFIEGRYLDVLFRVLFGRAPTAEERTYWETRLHDHTTYFPIGKRIAELAEARTGRVAHWYHSDWNSVFRDHIAEGQMCTGIIRLSVEGIGNGSLSFQFAGRVVSYRGGTHEIPVAVGLQLHGFLAAVYGQNMVAHWEGDCWRSPTQSPRACNLTRPTEISPVWNVRIIHEPR